jgi:hypothetical protein
MPLALTAYDGSLGRIHHLQAIRVLDAAIFRLARQRAAIRITSTLSGTRSDGGHQCGDARQDAAVDQ